MKKPNLQSITLKKGVYATVFFYLIICSILLLIVACRKADQLNSSQSLPGGAPQLNPQEQTLIGRWDLKRSETYEITGVDSSGQYVDVLIGSSECDSVCGIEFKNEYSWPPNKQELKGRGSIGGCDSTVVFSWKAKQAGKLETAAGISYDILYLANDSTAFSCVYTKDILTLRSVMYYKKK